MIKSFSASVLLCVLALNLSAQAQMNFANTNGAIAAALPTGIYGPAGWTSNPSSNQLAAIGWLAVSNVQTVAAGYVATAYAVVPVGNGWCTLAIASSNNIQAMFLASITNSPLWTPGFISVLQSYRSLIRAYDGFGAESNAVVSLTTSEGYFATNQPFIQVATNVFNAAYLNDIAARLTSLPGITNTAQFWQLGLVP